MTGAAAPPHVCWKTHFTGPDAVHPPHGARTPLPYGSPIAPACVTSVRIFAAMTGIGNAGTVIDSVPR